MTAYLTAASDLGFTMDEGAVIKRRSSMPMGLALGGPCASFSSVDLPSPLNFFEKTYLPTKVGR